MIAAATQTFPSFRAIFGSTASRLCCCSFDKSPFLDIIKRLRLFVQRIETAWCLAPHFGSRIGHFHGILIFLIHFRFAFFIIKLTLVFQKRRFDSHSILICFDSIVVDGLQRCCIVDIFHFEVIYICVDLRYFLALPRSSESAGPGVRPTCFLGIAACEAVDHLLFLITKLLLKVIWIARLIDECTFK